MSKEKSLDERLDEIAEKISETKQERAASLVLTNENARQYTIIALPVGWQVTDQKPFDLQQSGYEFLSKWQAGICPQEVEGDGEENDETDQ